MKTFFSIILELIGFFLVLVFFSFYINERKGVEYNPMILKGAKLYRDEKGVRIFEKFQI